MLSTVASVSPHQRKKRHRLRDKECLGAAAAAGSSRWGSRLSSIGRCPWHGNSCEFDGVLTEDVDHSPSNPKLP